MNFRTQIPLKKVHNQIDYSSKIVLFGSCFTENISNKLSYFKFENFSNPFGILFHSTAIKNSIVNAINENKYSENDCFLSNENWCSFDAHSELNNASKEEFLKNLNTTISETHTQLKEATHLIITLGTSWVYRHLESDKIVANCHKIPQKKFLKELLSVDDISSNLEAIICLLKNINPKIEIIFTVSPVRHLKDGFTENSLSKAHLISAIHNVIEPRNHIHYFPSFEIMMDDLRDYRFYNSDMIHPNETAINYIWETFKTVWINEKTTDLMNEIDAIQKGLSHKPFNEKTTQHQQFLSNLKLRIKNLQEQHAISF